VPAYVRNRRKAGFGMPIRSIFGSPTQVWQLLDAEFLAGMEIFDVAHVRRLVDAHVEGREDNSSIIYALISFQEWHREYFR
jgi:hypothetical protein